MSRHELDPAAVGRIAKRLRERGPGIVRRARFVHRARPVAVVVAIPALVLLLLPNREEQPVVADARACASWSRVEPQQGDRLELGPRGLAIATGDIRLVSQDPCATDVVLARGRVVVHARELGGGELRVVSGTEIVIARGTVFAVEREDSSLAVEVAEGHVELSSTEPIRIQSGERLVRDRGSIARAPLTEARRDSIMVAVGLLAERPPIETEQKIEPERRPKKQKKRTAPSPEPVKSPQQLLLEGHEARKGGDLDRARALFARAGQDLESAWMSLARMELDASRPDGAIAALDERQQRYGEGTLAIEAAWLRVRALDARHERREAETEARRILDRWPRSPYADSAKRWLEKGR